MHTYQWVLAFHIIAVISWMAGMLYLPRLFVYHTQAKTGSDASEMLKVMEKRLLRFIINPAMIITLLSGATLLYLNPALLHAGYMHAKFAFVFLLFVTHGFYARARKDFERDANTRSTKFWKILNEVPTLLMIGIVIFVIVKPF
jgi:putative membrane protein